MASEFPSGSASPTADFEAVALPFMDALYGRAFNLTHSEADAGDLVQETYLRAYRAFAGFTPGTNCKAWLFTILYSIFVNQYRKGQRAPDTVSLEELEADFHRPLADENWEADFNALTNAELDWQGPEITAALGKLPENFRSAVLLVDVEELNYEEAAGVLDCPVGTLRSRLFRARKILFMELRDYARKTGFLREPHV
jgi:RNA polymerase sigma-70 factor, ECF subfamily